MYQYWDFVFGKVVNSILSNPANNISCEDVLDDFIWKELDIF